MAFHRRDVGTLLTRFETSLEFLPAWSFQVNETLRKSRWSSSRRKLVPTVSLDHGRTSACTLTIQQDSLVARTSRAVVLSVLLLFSRDRGFAIELQQTAQAFDSVGGTRPVRQT